MRKLGQGTYGKVQLGINKETGQEVNVSASEDLMSMLIGLFLHVARH